MHALYSIHDGNDAQGLPANQVHLAFLTRLSMGQRSGRERSDHSEKSSEIREKYKFPVIMLTAKTEYMDKITGLTLGADDYIPKPFNPLELVARVKAQLRRYTQYHEGTKEEKDVIDFGGLFLNRTSRECVYNEKNLTLTPIEFEILWLLCENRGKVISSEELFEKVENAGKEAEEEPIV